MPDAREVAYEITRRVSEEGAYLGLLVRYSMGRSGLDSRDRALVSELCYGVQRHRGKLDFIISNFSDKPLEKIRPEVLDLLRLGAYQIAFMRVPDHAAVYESVELAKRRLSPGSAAFVNAVLRKVASSYKGLDWPGREDFARFLETEYSHPRWLIDYIMGYMERDEAEAFCRSNNKHQGMTLRVNPHIFDRETLLEEIRRKGGSASLSQFLGEALVKVQVPWDELQRLLEQGACVVQDESSMLVSHAVCPGANMTIIDACAAPGGKATHMAQMGGKSCRVLAIDKSAARLEALRNLARRLGLKNVEPVIGDAIHLGRHIALAADAVLVDAPCSGLGTLRRRPELKWRRSEEELESFFKVQLALLEGSSELLRPGGALVYSVCTFTREETTQVIEAFLKRHPDFHPESLKPFLPPLLREWVSEQGNIQLMPHIHNMEGMFIARMARSRA